MKTLLCTLLLTVMLGACQSHTYYSAQKVNQNRFGEGVLKDNADFLNETHDLVLLLDAMSTSAMKQSIMKETYLLAKNAHEASITLDDDFILEAGVKRIKLASVLSQSSDDYLHQLDQISSEKIDLIYLQYMQTKVTDLVTKMNKYAANGKDQRLIQFADKVLDTIAPISKSLEENSISTSKL